MSQTEPTDPIDPVNPLPARKPVRRVPMATLSEFDGVRYLHLGNTPWVQGAMRLRKPRKLELDYVQRMMAWLLLRDPADWPDVPDTAPASAWPALHAVQLGLGAATLTRYCHDELRLRTTAVELNPQVIAACRQWFRLGPNTDRLQVIYADAGDWVADPARAGTADVLCVDLYDHQAAAPVLDGEDFYAHCHALLAPGGVMAVNLFGRSASFNRSARRIQAAFAGDGTADGTGEGGQTRFLVPTEEGNTIVLAIKGRAWPDAHTLASRAAHIAARTGMKADEWVNLIRPVPAARARRAPDAVRPAHTEIPDA